MDMLLSTGEQVSVALMAIAIHSLGNQALSLTGAQIGVKTDASFRKARIKSGRFGWSGTGGCKIVRTERRRCCVDCARQGGT
jgi:hypothetical protein